MAGSSKTSGGMRDLKSLFCTLINPRVFVCLFVCLFCFVFFFCRANGRYQNSHLENEADEENPQRPFVRRSLAFYTAKKVREDLC